MKKIFLLALIITVNQTQLLAQKSKEVVYITDKVEKPKSLSILSLELPIWHLSGTGFNTSLYDLKSSLSYVGAGKINGGATFNWKLGDRVMPDNYERTEYVNNDMVMSKYKSAPAQSLEVWGAYFFQESLNPTKVTIRLKKVGNVIYETHVDTKEHKKMGIRLGYKQGYTWYSMNNMALSMAPTATPELVETINLNTMSTYQEYKTIKAGIAISKATNVKVKIDGYGERKSTSVIMNCFSLIYAVQNSFEDVLVGRYNTNNNELEFVEYTLTDENKKLPIGFEFTHKETSKGWWSWEYGIGYYPGLMKKINLGVHFGASVNIDFLRNNNKL